MSQTGEDARTVTTLLRLALPNLALGVLIALAIQYVDLQLSARFSWVSQLPEPEEDGYVGFLSAIATTGAVFIGLYYAAVSTVSASAYAHVKGNIRELLARERLGTVYMRFLAILTFVSLGLLVFHLIGLPYARLALPVVGLSAGVGIFAFVQLGQRAFYLSDPVSLSRPVLYELRGWLDNVRQGGYRWLDPNFQNHARREATSLITTLDDLATFIHSGGHALTRGYTRFSTSLASLFLYYLETKKRIPSRSRWFARKYEHKEWYLADDTAVEMAVQTGRALQPEEVVDRNWLEQLVIEISERGLHARLAAGDAKGYLELLAIYVQCLVGLSKAGNCKSAFERLRRFSDSALSEISRRHAGRESKAPAVEYLAVVEAIAFVPAQFLIGYIDGLTSFDRDVIVERLRSSFDGPRSIYSGNWPSFLLPDLEWLQERITFERRIEARRVTPQWYQAEILALAASRVLLENIDGLTTESADLFDSWFTAAQENGGPWIAAAVLRCEWEYLNKLLYHLDAVSAVWDRTVVQTRLPDLSWPEIDTTTWRQRVLARQLRLRKRMADAALSLTSTKPPSDLPDYGGQFLNETGEGIHQAAMQGDPNGLIVLFPTFFNATLQQYANLVPFGRPDNPHIQMRYQVAFAPLLDLIEMSGNLYLLAEFHDKPQLWSVVETTWNAWLSNQRASDQLTFLAASMSLHDFTFGIHHRDLIRTRWRMQIHSLLETLPLVRLGGDSRYGTSLRLHKHGLVRVCAESMMGIGASGQAIFVEFYLARRPESSGLQFGRAHRSISERIELNDRKYEAFNRSIGDDE